MEQEKRVTEQAELQPTNDTDKKVISGYALKFGKPSKDLGGFIEVVTPEALKEIDLSNVYLLYNHDYSKPLASVKAKTLHLNIDEVGLHFKAELPNTSYANDVYENVSKNIINSMSFGFILGLDSFSKDDKGVVVRSIDKMNSLNEISIVTIPAYDSTNVQVNKRSYEKYVSNNSKIENKQEKEKMDKTLLDNQNTEIRGYESYIRSQGEERDGITTENAAAVVPKDIIKNVFRLKRNKHQLSQYATVKTVTNGQGTLPIAKNQKGTLMTKKELEEIKDVEAEMFAQVDYKVETRAGKVALSNEVIEDSEIDVVEEVQGQMEALIDNTDNENMIKLLKTFPKKEVTSLDELKKVYNVDLDSKLDKMFLINQECFNWLDTLKDSDGRYIMQPDITSPSGKSLFGSPVDVLSNDLLANPKAGTYPMILGDIEQSILIARRNKVTTQWEKFDYYSQGLAVVVRNDYKKIDADASAYIEITPATA